MPSCIRRDPSTSQTSTSHVFHLDSSLCHTYNSHLRVCVQSARSRSLGRRFSMRSWCTRRGQRISLQLTSQVTPVLIEYFARRANIDLMPYPISEVHVHAISTLLFVLDQQPTHVNALPYSGNPMGAQHALCGALTHPLGPKNLTCLNLRCDDESNMQTE